MNILKDNNGVKVGRHFNIIFNKHKFKDEDVYFHFDNGYKVGEEMESDGISDVTNILDTDSQLLDNEVADSFIFN